MIGQQSSLKVPIGAGRYEQRWRVAAVCLGLAAITFAVFSQTLHHDFIDFDDNVYVGDNPMVAPGLTLQGIVWAFTHVYSCNWHPLTWLSHMLDCQLYGLNPAGHHLTNVLLHTATVIALFLVLRQMTGALWRSAFVAAVFAIHPLRVESVAWVAERKDVLSGLFFMLTIGAYVRYARRPWSAARYGLVVLLFAMGLMCKPMLVTLPVVLLLLDYWPLQRVEPRKLSGLALEKLPLLALSAAVAVATLLVQNEAIQSSESFSPPLRLANALAACKIYLVQMVYPAGLAVFYSFPHNGPSAWEAVFNGTLLAILSAVAWGERRTRPWLLTGWVWYLVMLLPVVGFIQVGKQAHADRYTYLPQIGIYVALTWLAAEWRVSRGLLGGFMAGVLAVLMVCAWKQTAYWQNSETLWAHALACTTDNYTAHINFGDTLLQKGRVGEAITHGRQAVQLRPDLAQAHNNLGNALRQNGSLDEAIIHFQKALQLKPRYADAHNNLGTALFQKGKADEAVMHFQKALQISPNYAGTHCNLGLAFFLLGRTDEAIAQYQKALQLKPDYEEAHKNLGLAFFRQGRMDEAIAQYQKALELKPGNIEAQKNLAWVLATCPQAGLRNGSKAVKLAEQASQLAGGGNPLILGTLAAAYAEVGRFSEAVETAQRALRLAGAQSNTNLAGQLQAQLKFYQAGSPFHSPEQTH
jgi:tetratricopeptide (TPR) repeat protein